jgi:hypothetical protein
MARGLAGSGRPGRRGKGDWGRWDGGENAGKEASDVPVLVRVVVSPAAASRLCRWI